MPLTPLNRRPTHFAGKQILHYTNYGWHPATVVRVAGTMMIVVSDGRSRVVSLHAAEIVTVPEIISLCTGGTAHDWVAASDSPHKPRILQAIGQYGSEHGYNTARS